MCLFRALKNILFHAMLQVKGKNLKKDEGLKLKQGVTQFHCKKGSITITGLPTLKLGITFIILFLSIYTNSENVGAQEFTEAQIFCSFLGTLQMPNVRVNSQLLIQLF